MKTYDIAIIGGGIIGTATAKSLLEQFDVSVAILEAEPTLASHQTGHNSGVIHSGLYYNPGSLKAETCAKGRKKLYAFCKEHRISYDQCGKVVVAGIEEEIPRLDELERRGEANGLQGIERLTPEQILEFEPHVRGIDGLHVPQTGIVDFIAVTEKYGEIVGARGGVIYLNTRVIGCESNVTQVVLRTTKEPIIAHSIINCAGLQSDRIARMCGVTSSVSIVPFRGEYYTLRPEKHYLVNNLIYPVPDPAFPFLGVHFTRMIHGGIEAGPNAVLAFKREGYNKSSFSFRDTLDFATFSGFWKLVMKYWKTGTVEMYRSLNKQAFVRALQRLIPEIGPKDCLPGGAGVRAQALNTDGKLLDDFAIETTENSIHVLNAPSPGATASLAIGDQIADMAKNRFAL